MGMGGTYIYTILFMDRDIKLHILAPFNVLKYMYCTC